MNFNNWLQQTFYKDNHNKYKHYYSMWMSNLTESQIEGFMNQYNRIYAGKFNLGI